MVDPMTMKFMSTVSNRPCSPAATGITMPVGAMAMPILKARLVRKRMRTIQVRVAPRTIAMPASRSGRPSRLNSSRTSISACFALCRSSTLPITRPGTPGNRVRVFPEVHPRSPEALNPHPAPRNIGKPSLFSGDPDPPIGSEPVMFPWTVRNLRFVQDGSPCSGQ